MDINEWCKKFRTDTLKLTLNEMSEITGTNLKTISAYEHGRSSNIAHLYLYVDCCVDTEQEEVFLNGINQVMRSNKNV